MSTLTASQEKYLKNRLNELTSDIVRDIPRGLTQGQKRELFAKGKFEVREGVCGNYNVVFPEELELIEKYHKTTKFLHKKKQEILDAAMFADNYDLAASLEALKNTDLTKI